MCPRDLCLLSPEALGSLQHIKCHSWSLVPKRMDPPAPDSKTKIKAKMSPASQVYQVPLQSQTPIHGTLSSQIWGAPPSPPQPHPSPQGWWRWELAPREGGCMHLSWRALQPYI